MCLINFVSKFYISNLTVNDINEDSLACNLTVIDINEDSLASNLVYAFFFLV